MKTLNFSRNPKPKKQLHGTTFKKQEVSVARVNEVLSKSCMISGTGKTCSCGDLAEVVEVVSPMCVSVALLSR